MNYFFVFSLVLVVFPDALVQAEDDYHRDFGIPSAARVRLAEQKSRALFTRHRRSVGSSPAGFSAHPYFAGLIIDLKNSTLQSLCGATLVSSTRLLTAAHCWRSTLNQAVRLLVVLGSNYLFSGGTRIATSDVIEHPQYTPGKWMNDIAIINISNPVSFTPSIQPIQLPSDVWNTYEEQWAITAGFGRTSDGVASVSTRLNHVKLQVISNAECLPVYGPNLVRPTVLCTSGAGNVGICDGDSGGPLVLDVDGTPTLIGVGLFAADEGCQLGLPSAFTRVSSFIEFIQQYRHNSTTTNE